MHQHQMLAAVTHTLTKLLEKRMRTPPGTINSLPPDVQMKDPPGPKRVNLFLYRVVENPHLRNMDRGSPPGSYGRPPLSLDLHYLLTAYGTSEEDSKGAQEILGDAMTVLHDHPLIHPKDPAYADVRDLLLDEAVEQLKVGMEPITTEDMTKVWTALTVPYRLSASYVVNVVQMPSRRVRVRAPPVRDGARDPRPVRGADGPDPSALEGRRLQVRAFEPPGLDAVLVLRPGQSLQDKPHIAYAAVGDRLVLEGHSFGSPPPVGASGATVVHIGPLRIPLPAPAATHTPNRIVLPLPDDPALQPGPVTVHVSVQLGGGELSSNRRPLLLVPYVEAATKTTADIPDEDWEAPPDTPPGTPPPNVTVQAVRITGTRLHRTGGEGRAILSKEVDLPGGGKKRAVVDVDGARYVDPTPTGITVPLPAGVDASGMTVRVLVDGHENLPRPGLAVTP